MCAVTVIVAAASPRHAVGSGKRCPIVEKDGVQSGRAWQLGSVLWLCGIPCSSVAGVIAKLTHLPDNERRQPGAAVGRQHSGVKPTMYCPLLPCHTVVLCCAADACCVPQFMLMGAQTGLVVWRKQHKRSYDLVRTRSSRHWQQWRLQGRSSSSDKSGSGFVTGTELLANLLPQHFAARSGFTKLAMNWTPAPRCSLGHYKWLTNG